MLVSKVMSSPLFSATANTTIREAAERMRAHGVGALPVFRDGDAPHGALLGREILGIVTDRDIVLRALAAPGSALGPDTSVTQIMSPDLITCFEDDDVVVAAELMGERRVLRLLVTDRAGATVGMLSLGDIAEHVSETLAGQALGEISERRARDVRG